MAWLLGGASALGSGCGGDPEITHGNAGRGGSGGTAGNGGSAGTIIFGGRGGTAGTGGDGGTGGGTPCEGVTCTPGQRCEIADGGAGQCVNNTCEHLACKRGLERCEPHPQGGNVCKDLTCTGDVQCLAAEFCNEMGTPRLCTPDVCEPGAAQCSGQVVRECQSNGGTTTNKFTCGSPAYYTSQCLDNGTNKAFCGCEDDWDCPANTVCEVGRCTGTGRAPSCTLAPGDFSQMTPAIEFQWGGNSRSDANARDGSRTALAPWHANSHVLNTPVVANLDDDNGDGLINELDFPEILFTSYTGDNPWSNGVVRAVHGGGPNKGKDYFARCGSKHWVRPAALPADTCTTTDADADSGTPVTVADLDYDGKPEIIYVTEGNTFRILDNRGALIYTLPTAWSPVYDGETVAVANLNYSGNAEIIVGRNVYVLGKNASGALIVTHIVTGTASTGRNEISMMACPADLLPDPGIEIVAGAALYKVPMLPACGTPPCTVPMNPVWNAKTITGQESRLTGDGFCAVADVWGPNAAARPGPNNRPEGKPEVILIDEGHLTILDSATGVIIHDQDLGGGDRGGAPNVDDFDGDGFMEIASALKDFYVVVDLQTSTGAAGMCPDWPSVIERTDANPPANNNPARTPPTTRCTSDAQCPANTACNETDEICVCLHNGWKRDSDDDSSKATSSSVFDFNGDGAAEVLYNDECEFRVYNGRTGQVLFKNVSNSRTGIENPVVADVDNDGNAEVVTVMNTEATD
ncbi:MAG TPA: VCBS repeat-containing protein, partial [Polyangiaceae bacterium]